MARHSNIAFHILETGRERRERVENVCIIENLILLRLDRVAIRFCGYVLSVTIYFLIKKQISEENLLTN